MRLLAALVAVLLRAASALVLDHQPTVTLDTSRDASYVGLDADGNAEVQFTEGLEPVKVLFSSDHLELSTQGGPPCVAAVVRTCRCGAAAELLTRLAQLTLTNPLDAPNEFLAAPGQQLVSSSYNATTGVLLLNVTPAALVSAALNPTCGARAPQGARLTACSQHR